MKNFMFTLAVLGLVVYLHKQYRRELFFVWTDINSLKLAGEEFDDFPL